METNIIVPELGPGVTQARLIKWRVAVGQQVEQYDPVAELETEKATLEISALAAGVVRELTVAEGATVSAGTVLGSIQNSFLQNAAQAGPRGQRPVRSFVILGLLLLLVVAGFALLMILLKGQGIGFLQ